MSPPKICYKRTRNCQPAGKLPAQPSALSSLDDWPTQHRPRGQDIVAARPAPLNLPNGHALYTVLQVAWLAGWLGCCLGRLLQ